MLLKQMEEFNSELIDEIRDIVNKGKKSSEDIFTNIFSEYVIEAGGVYLSNFQIINFKKDSDHIKVNGYAYDEYFKTLTLIVTDFNNRFEIKKMGKVEIDKCVKLASNFYRKCKGDYFKYIEESSEGYALYEFIEQIKVDVDNIQIVLLTNKLATNYTPDDKKVDKKIIKHEIWDLERVCQYIYQKRSEENLVIRLHNKYDYDLKMIKMKSKNDIYDCYIGIISGICLAKIYEDKGQKIIEKNVRSFLQATGKVNKGIKNTLLKEPEMFMAYNNGISTIADEIHIDEKKSNGSLIVIKEIVNWQIVNGGQTTVSIYNAYQNKVLLDNVDVQIKLSVIKNKEMNEEIVNNISKYANSQNKINMSDFSANDDYHIQMARLSEQIYIPVEKGKSTSRWFYERARGQYMVELNRRTTKAEKNKFKEQIPKKQCISKTVAAKCIMCWRQYPYIVAKGLESNFVEFSKLIKQGEISKPNEKQYISMISKVILFQKIDKMVADLKLGGYKAQVNYYTMSLLSKYHSDEVDDQYIWKYQNISPRLESRIEDIISQVWTHFMNPVQPGINITQWCKKEECWVILKSRYERVLNLCKSIT